MKLATSVCVVGAGQAGLNCGFYLGKRNVPYLILDSNKNPGGNWSNYWPSLQLFSPGKYSALAGDTNFKNDSHYEKLYPQQKDVVDYFIDYSTRNNIKCINNVEVQKCEKNQSLEYPYLVTGKKEGKDIQINCKAIINCSGIANKPFIPKYKNIEKFKGNQIHSIDYRTPNDFINKNVVVIGEGNSGAQIFAEIAPVSNSVIWMTKEEPTFYRDDIDGSILFDQAHSYREMIKNNVNECISIPPFRFSSIIMVDSVKEARNRGFFSCRMPSCYQFTENGLQWEKSAIVNTCLSKNKSNLSISYSENFVDVNIDSIIWCTGFLPAIDYIHDLIPTNDLNNFVYTNGQAKEHPNIWFVGYGDWCGYGSGSIAVSSWFAKDATSYLINNLT